MTPHTPGYGRWIQVSPRVYRFVDICNVYALVADRAALLIDFGAGDVIDRLADIGVDGVEWVLYTHAHRDQCQGDPARRPAGTRVAVPRGEAAAFGQAEGLWQTRRLFDR